MNDYLLDLKIGEISRFLLYCNCLINEAYNSYNINYTATDYDLLIFVAFISEAKELIKQSREKVNYDSESCNAGKPN